MTEHPTTALAAPRETLKMNAAKYDVESAHRSSNDIGRYRLIAELATGGMGVVYLAVVSGPSGFSKLFVVKELKASLSDDPDFLGMFLDEARLAARLSHPNIVQTMEVNQDADRNYLVMEYLEGQPLHRTLSRVQRGLFPVNLHAKVLCEVLAGLHYAHELADYDGRALEVVHRDVSPQNVFLTYDGQVKLVDFGIAKAGGATQQTRAGVLKGKLGYMAPEQARGRPVDRRADVYSVGVMLWEALAGRRMWDKGTTDIAILSAVISGELPNVRQFAPAAPPELVRIAEKAIALDPNQRYGSAASMLADIESYLRTCGEAPSARQAADLVSRAFVNERAQMRTLVEGGVRRLDDESIPPSQRSLVRLTTGADGPTTDSKNNSGPSSLSAAVAPQRAPSSRAFALVGFGVGLIAVCAITAVVLLGRKHDKGVVAAASADPSGLVADFAAGPAPAAAPVAAPHSTVQVSVNVTPANAVISIDGAKVNGNPYSGGYPMDGAHHRLHVDAPGFVGKTQEIVFDRDSNVSIALERIPFVGAAPKPATPTAAAADVRPAAAPVAAAPAAPAVEATAAGPAKPKRLLSGDDPYK
jgi:serine/threonine-protein kinase